MARRRKAALGATSWLERTAELPLEPGVYLSGQGVAFVDLSAEATTAHRGGSLDEIFTVYSIVNTLTENLPAITAVQLLVNGRQVDTLAGHVDVRRPLAKDLRWTELPRGAETRTASGATPVAPPPD